MRAPVRWLKDYVSFDDAPEVLGDRLTMAGIPVEGIERPCEGLRNIVTGLIRSVDPHPNAERLSVCQLDLGDKTVKIVTAATNVRAGQIVPVALSGAILADGKKIEAADFQPKKFLVIPKLLRQKKGTEFMFCRRTRNLVKISVRSWDWMMSRWNLN